MIKATLDVKAAIKALRAIKALLADLRPAYRTIIEYLRKATERQFSSEGSRSGDPWQPLSRAYAEWKAIAYPGKPILRATDAMFKSLVGKTTDSVERITKTYLTYGTRRKYARYHQKGGGRLPKRKILAVTDADRREVKKLARLHLEQQSILSGFQRT